jgi:hypothetical protein
MAIRCNVIYVIYAMIIFCNISRLACRWVHNRQEPYGCIYNCVWPACQLLIRYVIALLYRYIVSNSCSCYSWWRQSWWSDGDHAGMHKMEIIARRLAIPCHIKLYACDVYPFMYLIMLWSRRWHYKMIPHLKIKIKLCSPLVCAVVKVCRFQASHDDRVL